MHYTVKKRKGTSSHLHEEVEMPDRKLAIRSFYYEQEGTQGVFPLHWHEQIEFIYVRSGGMHVTCNNRSITARTGDLIVINSNEYHRCDRTEAPLSLNCVIADMSLLNSRFYDACEEKYILPLFQNRILFQNLIANDSRVTDHIRQIAKENEFRETGYELAIKASLFNLLVNLFRRYITKILTPREQEASNRNLQRISTVISHIESNFADEISIDELSDTLCINKHYFCRLFKAYTGKTLTEYTHAIRIREAVGLLKEADASITEIAMKVGFNDVNYFTRVFKHHTNMTPSKLRNQRHTFC